MKSKPLHIFMIVVLISIAGFFVFLIFSKPVRSDLEREKVSSMLEMFEEEWNKVYFSNTNTLYSTRKDANYMREETLGVINSMKFTSRLFQSLYSDIDDREFINQTLIQQANSTLDSLVTEYSKLYYDISPLDSLSTFIDSEDDLVRKILKHHFKMRLVFMQRQLLEDLLDNIGASDVAFSSNEEMMARRGSRSKSIREVKDLSPPSKVVENEWILTEFFSEAFVYPTASFESYLEFSASIVEGRLPQPASIQINEMVNYLQYPIPHSEEIISTYFESSVCPWNEDNQVLLIGIEVGGAESTQITDLNLEIEFDEEIVSEYRLLGQEGEFLTLLEPTPTPLANKDQTIVLFELKMSETSEKWGSVIINYQGTGNAPQQVNASIIPIASENTCIFQASTMAELALLLRDSRYKGRADLGHVIGNLENLLDDGSSIQIKNILELTRMYQNLLSTEAL